MRSSRDDIRRRIEKRKRERERLAGNSSRPRTVNYKQMLWAEEEEKHGFDRISSYEGGPDEGAHPLFRKEIFLFKVLASACLFLVIAIIFRNEGESLNSVRNFVTSSMEKDFQFAAISDWYEDQFGKPLALLPFTKDKEAEEEPQLTQQYALPASGKILEEFGSNGQRITIETAKGSPVEAMNEGFVRFTGSKEGFGKTVIVQHADKSETWYGNLDSIDVTLYEFIEKGNSVGKASDGADGTKGTFYFAIKKGDDFIDPIQVIQFD
ncbi:M23 family metallopeptidase (plasmid) [Bacillus sp. 31A1R]|uniref:M23 family metallopeptidase n=1 Tax=Robertmurraya mangrovi TaxID=3098077 RepID=A0ABU5IUP5_9BACI|nr:M23 family metallopeptidase [Bacillus sp. 31A1R]MDZ5470821.1 M23 family metallopeptidase [Bacillus sp. 31A1R]